MASSPNGGLSKNRPLLGLAQSAVTRATATFDKGFMRAAGRRFSTRARPPGATHTEDARAKLVELGRVYRALAPDFTPPPPPAEVRMTPLPSAQGATRAWDLAYPSHYLPALPGYLPEAARYEANATARARLYTQGTSRPVIVCIHGWGGGAYWFERRAFVVDYWLHHGHDIVLFQLPFHGERTPVQAKRSGALFPSYNVARTNEALGQAIWDLRALRQWLTARGATSVGTMGMSLGGYTAALWASVDDQLDSATALIPAVNLAELMWDHGANSPARRRAEKLGIDRQLIEEAFAVHSPLARAPLLPPERLFIIAGHGDRITPPEQATALWHHWGKPEIHWFAGGHLAQIGRSHGFRMLRRHLDRLRATTPGARNSISS